MKIEGERIGRCSKPDDERHDGSNENWCRKRGDGRGEVAAGQAVRRKKICAEPDDGRDAMDFQHDGGLIEASVEREVAIQSEQIVFVSERWTQGKLRSEEDTRDVDDVRAAYKAKWAKEAELRELREEKKDATVKVNCRIRTGRWRMAK